jgi:glucoamylase
MWAHSEYVKLLRSVVDKRIFDLIEPVAERYRNAKPRPVIEVWKMNRQVRAVPAGALLRVQASSPFLLHWSDNEWKTVKDTVSTPTAVGTDYADIEVAPSQTAPLRFTFFWRLQSEWQGANYQVNVGPAIQTVIGTRKAATGE